MPETPVVDQKLAPKSLLRHRPLDIQESKGETNTSPVFHPTVQRASRPIRPEPREHIATSSNTTASQRVAHMPSTSRPPVISHAIPTSTSSKTLASKTATSAKIHNTARKTLKRKTIPHARISISSLHPLLLLGLGMLTMLLLWTLVTTVVGWASTTIDDLHYGRPRTYQVDMYVGHNEHPGHPSHFVVVNLNRHIDIIELQGGDPAHTHIYVGPTLTGTNADLTPATVRFISVAGQKYPNMVLVVGSSQLFYLNKGGIFVPSPT